MSANLRLSVVAVALALLSISGGAVNTRLSDVGSSWILGAVAAESGGHDSGGESGGGHTGGKGGEKDTGGEHTSGGHSGGSGHSGGGEVPGAENKGHGLRKGHVGHEAGQHQGGETEHDVGGRRFTGGNGTTASATVPEGIGRYGSPQFRDAFRYWGGRSLADDPTDPTDTTDPTKTTDPTSVATSDLVPAGAGGGASVNVRTTLEAAGRCDDMDSGSMTAGQRFSGANLNRIASAQALLDPTATMERPGANPYLLATFQQELLQSSPDLTTAGLYVALVAKGPVSAGKIKSVGMRLCVPVSDTQAQQIAEAAENQRVALK